MNQTVYRLCKKGTGKPHSHQIYTKRSNAESKLKDLDASAKMFKREIERMKAQGINSGWYYECYESCADFEIVEFELVPKKKEENTNEQDSTEAI